MEQMGASKETLEELQWSGTDGNELVFCMDTGRQSNENIEMVEKQLKLAGNPLLCMRLRQRLTSEAANEREGRDQERRMEVQHECPTGPVLEVLGLAIWHGRRLAWTFGGVGNHFHYGMEGLQSTEIRTRNLTFACVLHQIALFRFRIDVCH